AGSSYRRSSVVSFRLVLSNPTLPEITDGYETQLHHSLGHDLSEPWTLSINIVEWMGLLKEKMQATKAPPQKRRRERP
ncbi:hypothetical protein, partial [Rhizobium sp. PL01]|uniref:hypothetical protein n=1 Tax=Rhizobium sp. PL01 TaxID=3085631 RepID=UPI0029824E1F